MDRTIFEALRGVKNEADWDELYDVKIIRTKSIDDLQINFSEPARYFIMDPNQSLPIDFLYFPSKDDPLYVGFHGAESRSNENFPKYQFVRSFNFTYKNNLYFFDTTLLLSKSLRLGWYIGDEQTDLHSRIADVIQSIAEAASTPKPVTLVGHSGGGFAAIAIGAKLPNSHAIAVNPQTVPWIYEPQTFEELVNSGFPGRSCLDVQHDFAERVDLRTIARSPRKSIFSLYANINDTTQFGGETQFEIFAPSLGFERTSGGTTENGDRLVIFDTVPHPPNAHALPGTVLPFIADSIPGSTRLVGQPASIKIIKYEDSKQVKELVESLHSPIEELDRFGWNAPILSVAAKRPDFHHGLGAFRYQTTVKIAGKEVQLDALHVKKDSDTLIVSFHGANNRATTKLPRFERLATLKTFNESSLYFSDPCLALDEELQLSWYTGSKEFDLHELIASWITQICLEHNYSRVILTGSSGGGFAALQVGSFIKDSIVVAFNAQTDISTYVVGTSFGAQKNYLKALWPKIFPKVADKTVVSQFGAWNQLVDSRVSAIRRYSLPVENHVYIIQNIEEYHFEDHFMPFVQQALNAGNKITLLTNREGPVHNPPKMSTFIAELQHILSETKVE